MAAALLPFKVDFQLLNFIHSFEGVDFDVPNIIGLSGAFMPYFRVCACAELTTQTTAARANHDIISIQLSSGEGKWQASLS